MTSFVWLGLAVLIAAVAALTGLKPARTRPVAGTQLMGVARVVLVLIVAGLLFVAWRARAGG